eukprot:9865837-Karenia_brevis.AAC.1
MTSESLAEVEIEVAHLVLVAKAVDPPWCQMMVLAVCAALVAAQEKQTAKAAVLAAPVAAVPAVVQAVPVAAAPAVVLAVPVAALPAAVVLAVPFAAVPAVVRAVPVAAVPAAVQAVLVSAALPAVVLAGLQAAVLFVGSEPHLADRAAAFAAVRAVVLAVPAAVLAVPVAAAAAVVQAVPGAALSAVVAAVPVAAVLVGSEPHLAERIATLMRAFAFAVLVAGLAVTAFAPDSLMVDQLVVLVAACNSAAALPAVLGATVGGVAFAVVLV